MGDNEPHTNGVNGGGESEDEVGYMLKMREMAFLRIVILTVMMR